MDKRTLANVFFLFLFVNYETIFIMELEQSIISVTKNAESNL